jgi:hypothetical protein
LVPEKGPARVRAYRLYGSCCGDDGCVGRCRGCGCVCRWCSRLRRRLVEGGSRRADFVRCRLVARSVACALRNLWPVSESHGQVVVMAGQLHHLIGKGEL